MHIDNHGDVIASCRFCFMCRHLDPVGNVTFREADTPRGRALILDRVRMAQERLANPDFIDTMYRSALSGANRQHCVSHYDETGLVLAARRDIVAAGLAPEPVKALAHELVRATFAIEGRGSSLYFGDHPRLYPECATLSGGDPGVALEALGFASEAAEVLGRLRGVIAASGSGTLVVGEPSSYVFLKKRLGGIAVVHCSEYLLSTAPEAGPARRAVYLESDFLRNYADGMDAPRRLLRRHGYELAPFGTNAEESHAVGEGAVVFDALQPELCKRLCRRIRELADNPAADLFITPSRHAKAALRKYHPEMRVVSLEEAVTQERSHK